MTVSVALLLTAVAAPLAAALASIGWPDPSPGDPQPRGARCRRRFAVGAASVSAVCAAVLAVSAGRGPEPGAALVQLTPHTWLALHVDPAGALYGATAASLWLLALVYVGGYVHGPRLGRLYGALMLCLAAALGVAYAGNLLTFFVFYELLSVLTYVLVVFDQTPAAVAAGRKYIVYVLFGGSLVLTGILLTFAYAGDLGFVAGGVFGDDVGVPALRIAFACFAIGFGVKAALMPLHGWVADAHPAAPAPCSALLSGVLVAAGGFGLVRVVFQIFGPGLLRASGMMPWLGGVAAFTVIAAALLALQQDDLKRRLAYSTVSQMGYLVLALSLLSPLATVGALVHLVHHAFLKATLFFCAGSFAHATGRRGMTSLAGLAARTPWTAAAFTLAALGLIGVPPLSGFVSKWWLGSACSSPALPPRCRAARRRAARRRLPAAGRLRALLGARATRAALGGARRRGSAPARTRSSTERRC
jgi:multicomponent Na+:H+ antiporter subunit D